MNKRQLHISKWSITARQILFHTSISFCFSKVAEVPGNGISHIWVQCGKHTHTHTHNSQSESLDSYCNYLPHVHSGYILLDSHFHPLENVSNPSLVLASEGYWEGWKQTVSQSTLQEKYLLKYSPWKIPLRITWLIPASSIGVYLPR